jgi:hypothetical protein
MQLPLDHNFPEPIVDTLKPWTGSRELLPSRQIDDRLTHLDDSRRTLSPVRFEQMSNCRRSFMRPLPLMDQDSRPQRPEPQTTNFALATADGRLRVLSVARLLAWLGED